MLRLCRAPRLASLTLAAFLVSQPVVGCALLCLVDQHTGLHEMAGMQGPSVTAAATCHTGIGAATRHGPAQTLSFMEPGRELVAASAATLSVSVSDARPTAVPQACPGLDPPPPRLV
jgi:hypothetical protein